MKDLLHSAHLTKTQRIIAEYVLDNASEACFMTSTEIALKLGVSESSVIRFSRTIGFDGFMDFQKALRKDYQDKVHFQQYHDPIPAYCKAGKIRQLF